ncbi:MAG TPA: hypothetical protein VHM64_23405 [Candidatus Binatia bacterium]|nr:hypothetical protein [Candidatus Binatia bacterium]
MLNSWLHLVALVVYLGAVLGFSLVLLPAISPLENREDRARLLARALKFYNPLQVGALGILLFSGAFQLTELKAAYRETFVQELGVALAVKLSLAFLVVLFSVYQAMGVGHRFVKRYEGGEPVSEQDFELVRRRLTRANWLIVPLAVMTAWYGLRLRG